ncbi:ABC transporter permease [bacterium]|nr:ABC transporter permease [bacterium]
MNEGARDGEPRIGKQIALPWSKAIEIAAKSVKVRFWRSMITMSSIVLAIAFLMSIWTSTAMTAALDMGPRIKIAEVKGRIAAAVDPAEQANLRLRLGELEAMKGEVDAILQEERGTVGAEGMGIEAPAQVPASMSATDFISRMSPTDTWLAILALLVCLVGIANAMFMTVQERFREIGTMKCLGALDGFIVKIFLVESAALGLIGTLLGVAVGLLLSALRNLFVYGGPAWIYFPWQTVFVAGVLATFIGLALSIGAAIWPAAKAARMEPVEAMRVDE